MSTGNVRLPDLMPVLSRGKHRNPRKGACFMEFASFLAGERWSDHPSCTHPLLARLARLINDYTSDAGRQRLVSLIPSVVGLTSDDPRVDLRIALTAARTALPVVSEERQRSMAVTVLVANQLLAKLDGEPVDRLDDVSRRALEQAPGAAQWAYRTVTDIPVSLRGFCRRGAPAAVLYAVDGIAKACISDPDGLLHDVLATTIADCTAMIGRADPATGAAAPATDLAAGRR